MRIPGLIMFMIILGFTFGVSGYVSNLAINLIQSSEIQHQQVEITNLQHQIKVLTHK